MGRSIEKGLKLTHEEGIMSQRSYSDEHMMRSDKHHTTALIHVLLTSLVPASCCPFSFAYVSPLVCIKNFYTKCISAFLLAPSFIKPLSSYSLFPNTISYFTFVIPSYLWTICSCPLNTWSNTRLSEDVTIFGEPCKFVCCLF